MVGGALSIVNARAGRRVVVWAIITAVLASILDFVPLFDVLGYDFSFAIGLAAAVASVDIGCGVVQSARRGGRPDGVLRLAGEAAAWSCAVLVLPLVLSVANAARVRNCTMAGGLAFFALLPVGSAIYAGVAGALAALVWPRRARLLAFALPAVSIVWTLVRLYVDPPVFAYDPFGGYFPGPIYDEALRPSATLFAFRLVNLLWLGAALAVAVALGRARSDGPPALGIDVRRWRRGPAALAVVLIAASWIAFAARGRLGFHVRRADLAAVLDGERHSSRVILHYAVSPDATRADLDATMEDLEFRYDQLRDTFHVQPDGPITVYQFPTSELKKALVGAGGTLYAKPWTREIFVQVEPFPSRRLRHEMAHVFAASFGDPLFGVAATIAWKGPIPIPRFASGLIEGVAEAADFTDPYGGSTTHQEAAAIIADGRAPPLADLMGAAFSAVSGPRAYTLAGSFCRFLLETRGADRLRAIYHSAGDFTGVYGESLGDLEREWRAFLARQPLSAEQQARAREEFRRPAIFRKVCAREQAARIAEARSLMPGAPTRAAHILEQACDDDPDEPTTRIEWAQAIAETGDGARALGVLAAVERDAAVTPPVRARAAGAAAAVNFARGDFANARRELTNARADASDEVERRQITAKLRALDDEPARRTLGRALFGDGLDTGPDLVLAFFLISEFARLHPDDALGPYLVGRQLSARDARSALPFLRAACEPPAQPHPLSTDFLRECRRLLMRAAYRAGDLERSRATAEALRAESQDEAERLRAGDFLARIAWRQAKQ